MTYLSGFLLLRLDIKCVVEQHALIEHHQSPISSGFVEGDVHKRRYRGKVHGTFGFHELLGRCTPKGRPMRDDGGGSVSGSGETLEHRPTEAHFFLCFAR